MWKCNFPLVLLHEALLSGLRSLFKYNELQQMHFSSVDYAFVIDNEWIQVSPLSPKSYDFTMNQPLRKSIHGRGSRALGKGHRGSTNVLLLKEGKGWGWWWRARWRGEGGLHMFSCGSEELYQPLLMSWCPCLWYPWILKGELSTKSKREARDLFCIYLWTPHYHWSLLLK